MGLSLLRPTLASILIHSKGESMTTRAVVWIAMIVALGGCKNQAKMPSSQGALSSPAPRSAASSDESAATRRNDPPGVSAASQYVPAAQYADPPIAGVGPTVEQAYAAIPHRRTVWVDSESSVQSEEKAYLKTVFEDRKSTRLNSSHRL